MKDSKLLPYEKTFSWIYDLITVIFISFLIKSHYIDDILSMTTYYSILFLYLVLSTILIWFDDSENIIIKLLRKEYILFVKRNNFYDKEDNYAFTYQFKYENSYEYFETILDSIKDKYNYLSIRKYMCNFLIDRYIDGKIVKYGNYYKLKINMFKSLKIYTYINENDNRMFVYIKTSFGLRLLDYIDVLEYLVYLIKVDLAVNSNMPNVAEDLKRALGREKLNVSYLGKDFTKSLIKNINIEPNNGLTSLMFSNFNNKSDNDDKEV